MHEFPIQNLKLLYLLMSPLDYYKMEIKEKLLFQWNSSLVKQIDPIWDGVITMRRGHALHAEGSSTFPGRAEQNPFLSLSP